MNEMIQRVAEAINNADQFQSGPNYPVLARAAIEAMRVPTYPMLEALNDMLGRWLSELPDDEVFDADIWRAMIDAALNDEGQR